MADHNIEVAASEIVVSPADEEDHCCAGSAEDEDTSPGTARLSIPARILVHREERPRLSSEFREIPADSAINQAIGRATALTG